MLVYVGLTYMDFYQLLSIEMNKKRYKTINKKYVCKNICFHEVGRG